MPVVAAHFYIGDANGEQLKTIPPDWYYTRFDAVDILYVGPAWCRNTDHTFSLQVNDKGVTNDFSFRIKRVVTRARWLNPQIKIIVSQWWGAPNVLAILNASPDEETTLSAQTIARIDK